MNTKSERFERHLIAIDAMMKKGGPELSEHEALIKICDDLSHMDLTLEQVARLHEIYKPVLTTDSVVGFCFLKPHGYTGDFEIIDKMYQRWKSPTSTKLHKWDDFFHGLHSVKAVRNRKDYFIHELSKTIVRVEKARVLDLASGPCTDIYEFFQKYPKNKVHFDCLDMDSKAIEYGSAICDNYSDSMTFVNRNAFRYKTDERYDLIWSAGLFDYFNDKLFMRLVARMYKLLADDGELVVGNFSDYNPSRGAMEIIGQWYMHHRSADDLIKLAMKVGIPKEKIQVNSEKTKVNLFLHLQK